MKKSYLPLIISGVITIIGLKSIDLSGRNSDAVLSCLQYIQESFPIRERVRGFFAERAIVPKRDEEYEYFSAEKNERRNIFPKKLQDRKNPVPINRVNYYLFRG